MEIKIGTTILAAGGKQSPQGLVIDDGCTVQRKRAIGANSVRAKQRDLVETRISFRVSIEHTSVEEAIDACVITPAEQEKEGVLTITTNGVARTLANAAIESGRHTHGGVSSHHEYVIIGGEFTVPAP